MLPCSRAKRGASVSAMSAVAVPSDAVAVPGANPAASAAHF